MASTIGLWLLPYYEREKNSEVQSGESSSVASPRSIALCRWLLYIASKAPTAASAAWAAMGTHPNPVLLVRVTLLHRPDVHLNMGRPLHLEPHWDFL